MINRFLEYFIEFNRTKQNFIVHSVTNLNLLSDRRLLVPAHRKPVTKESKNRLELTV